ncbi:MAG: UMP kinase [Lachnospiraceae bacterium]|nr:UMP kinase [Lachnospiraceae bacterium]
MDKKRVFLKLSGEAIGCNYTDAEGKKKNFGFNEDTVRDVARQVKEAVDSGVEIGVIIGGGNFWRGRTSDDIERTHADQIGMLATVMNCIYVSEIFRAAGIKTEIYTPFAVGTMTKLFSKDAANESFAQGKVVFFAGGTGHPYFSTDTGIALRAIEMEADVILLAKSIDGVYDSDPAINPDAKRYDVITMERVLDEQLKVIDLTATQMCYDNHKSLAVFDLRKENSISIAMKAFVGVDLKNEAEVKKLSESFDGTICIG